MPFDQYDQLAQLTGSLRREPFMIPPETRYGGQSQSLPMGAMGQIVPSAFQQMIPSEDVRSLIDILLKFSGGVQGQTIPRMQFPMPQGSVNVGPGKQMGLNMPLRSAQMNRQGYLTPSLNISGSPQGVMGSLQGRF